MNKQNIYKIMTFLSLGVIILASLIFGLNYYSNLKVTEGVQVTINAIMLEVANNGYVDLFNNQTTLTLVPVDVIQSSQNQVIAQILNQVKTTGKVVLYDNQSQFTLVLE
jgi:hypothetical protein